MSVFEIKVVSALTSTVRLFKTAVV